MPRLAMIALGGVIGSLARYLVATVLVPWPAHGWPWATFVVNVVGCLAIGVVASRLGGRPGWIRPFVITGILGGFTTFSAFALETGVLLDAGQVLMAAAYVLITLAGGLLAVRLGVLLAGRWDT